MAEQDPKPKKAKGGSALGVIVPVLVLTLVAGGGGFVVGKQIIARAKASVAGDAKPAGAPAPVTIAVKELTPVVANLLTPEGSWVRLADRHRV